mgnify:CR=1 FL=1
MKFTSKSDFGLISVEIFISKFHPNFASKYHSKCGQHSIRFQCRRHYVADIFGHSISPKMSPTFTICRRHLRRHFRRNYQNIGWVHRCNRWPASERAGGARMLVYLCCWGSPQHANTPSRGMLACWHANRWPAREGGGPKMLVCLCC